MANAYSDHPFNNAAAGTKGMAPPADTPYETPTFIRSKRSSHVTTGSSRDHSASPPLPETKRNGDVTEEVTYSKPDARRFTPNLHASLVSEILNLRRELESKNNLVEHLEVDLSAAKSENEASQAQLNQHANEVRKARQQVQLMEKETYSVVDGLVKDRDEAKQAADELRSRLEDINKKTRVQDEDAVRTQGIWENEKESWENERRQLERRIHITETRLRTVVEEMTAQHAAVEAQSARLERMTGHSEFKDSALGNDSDAASVRSVESFDRGTPLVHRIAHARPDSRMSVLTAKLQESLAKPSTNGFSLADELDELDDEEAEDGLEVGDNAYSISGLIESPKSPGQNSANSKARRAPETTADELPATPTRHTRQTSKGSFSSGRVHQLDSSSARPGSPLRGSILPADIALQTNKVFARKPSYVDTGYQPSPPTSPRNFRDRLSLLQSIQQSKNPAISNDVVPAHPVIRVEDGSQDSIKLATTVARPKQTTDATTGMTVSEHKRPVYIAASTQTDPLKQSRKLDLAIKQTSLDVPDYVPSIAIHPPASRPSSPRPCVLPPGTKNASSQANLLPKYTDSSAQTDEETRLEKRLSILNSEIRARLQPTFLTDVPTLPISKRHTAGANVARLLTKFSAPTVSQITSPLQSPTSSGSELVRDHSGKDLRSLRAIPLPRPVLSPIEPNIESTWKSKDGPLNRTSQYGVTRPLRDSVQLAAMDHESDASEDEGQQSEAELPVRISSLNPNRLPLGRFGLSDMPKAVPEDKEPSPERRPKTADSHIGGHTSHSSSSFAATQLSKHRHLAKLISSKSGRSRSPSFDSMISSNYSTQSMGHPPYPIPARSSSRVRTKSRSAGAQSPTKRRHKDGESKVRNDDKGKAQARSNSLRKTQSANTIRRPGTPPRTRRRRQSPALTPVQSMAFDTPDGEDGQGRDEDLDRVAHEHHTHESADLTSQPTADPSISDGQLAQETAVVDAIAATMVGEWMWKYVRKRKSFGMADDGIELSQEGPGIFTTKAHGTRHRRWVWLSPYERTIMWDNKQPTSGNALLGKKGRKFIINSAVDVEDHTPLPKGSSEGAHTKSICILTPERALKFTTFTDSRHKIWMIALAFLAQPDRLPRSVPVIPPLPAKIVLPTQDAATVKQAKAPAVGRSTIRDSVRLAKGQRMSFNHMTSQADVPAIPHGGLQLPPELLYDQSAEAPAVPRVSSSGKHSRQRSNTSPRLPHSLTSFRNHSSSTAPSTAVTLHPHSGPASTTHRSEHWTLSTKSAGSRRESLTVTGADQNNFFEAVGTVRMEAFVDPTFYDGVRYVPGPSIAPRRRRGDSNLSVSTIDRRRGGLIFDEEGTDPFKGF